MYIEETRNYWSTRAEGYTDCIMREYYGDAHQIWLDLIHRYKPEGVIVWSK